MATFATCEDLNNLPCNCDGSETKVTAGTNTSVTGSGTAADPYVINSSGSGTTADGSETKVTAGTNVTITGSGTTVDPYIVNTSADDVAITNVVNGNRIGTITINGVATDIDETITVLGTPTWNSTTGLLSIPYTDETGTVQTRTVTINPTFTNTDAQILVGDTTGTVNLTLTPVTLPDGTINYTLKADLPLATSVPSGGTNQLKYDAARGGWYVDPVAAPTAVGEIYVATLGANQSYGGRAFQTLDFNTKKSHVFDATVGAQVAQSANGLTVQPGYRYKVTACLQAGTATGGAWTAWDLQANGASVAQFYFTNGFGASGTQSAHCADYVFDATVATDFTVRNGEGTTASTWQFPFMNQMTVEVIKKL